MEYASVSIAVEKAEMKPSIEDLEKLKDDCATLTRKLQKLHDEEKLLIAKNEILGREILDLGYTNFESNGIDHDNVPQKLPNKSADVILFDQEK